MKPAAGLCLAIGFLSLCAYSYQAFLGLKDVERTSAKVRNSLKSRLESKDVSRVVKTKISRFYAQIRFREDGVIVHCFNRDGVAEIFKPTQEEIDDRDSFVTTNRTINLATQAARSGIFIWVTVIFISLTFGFFSPVKRKPRN